MAILAYEHAEVRPISNMNIGHQKVNVYGSIITPVFRTSEVASVLGIINQKHMIQDLDPSDKGMLRCEGEVSNQKVSFVTEYGLYEILFTSRKPLAKEFRMAVKKILHSLRLQSFVKTGNDSERGCLNVAPPTERGCLNVAPPTERGLYNIQPPSVKQLRAEFEYIKQAKKLLDLGAEEVRQMMNAVAQKYGLAAVAI